MVKYTDNVPLLNFIHSNTESIAANVVIKRIAIFLNGAVYKHAISLNGYFTIKILISSSCAFVSFIMCLCFWFSFCLRPCPIIGLLQIELNCSVFVVIFPSYILCIIVLRNCIMPCTIKLWALVSCFQVVLVIDSCTLYANYMRYRHKYVDTWPHWTPMWLPRFCNSPLCSVTFH